MELSKASSGTNSILPAAAWGRHRAEPGPQTLLDLPGHGWVDALSTLAARGSRRAGRRPGSCTHVASAFRLRFCEDRAAVSLAPLPDAHSCS